MRVIAGSLTVDGRAPDRPRQLTSRVPAQLLFIASTAVIALTRDPVVILLWLAVWYCSRRFATTTPQSNVLAFLVAFPLLYPESASSYIPGLHEAAVVGGVAMAAALWLCRHGIRSAWRQSVLFRVLLVGWLGWGLMAYLPVLTGWLISSVFHRIVPPLLAGLPIETSASKTAVPIIVAIAMAVVPVAALKTETDFKRLIELIVKLAAVVALLGLVQALLGLRFVETDYPLVPGRFGGLTVPDANSYGRVLVLPLLVAISAFMNGGKSLPLRKSVLAGSIAVLVVGILMTLSRTTFISCSIGIACLVMFSRRTSRATVAAGMLLLIIVIAVSSLGVLARFAPGEERASLANLDDREAIYSSLIVLAELHPWFGASPGGYYDGLREAGFQPKVMQSAHNMFLALTSEWGIPMAALLALGILGVVGKGLSALPKLRRLTTERTDFEATDVLVRACVACAIAFAVHGLTEFVPPDAVFLLFGVTLAALIRVSAAKAETRRLPRLSRELVR